MERISFLLFGIGIGFLILTLYFMYQHRKIENRMYRESLVEISELFLRDKKGDLFSVKIVIDPNLDDNEKQSGAHGTLDDLMEGRAPEGVADCDKFVISAKAAAEMREAGIELDMIVANILRSAGKIS
jgi:hypothetical protein